MTHILLKQILGKPKVSSVRSVGAVSQLHLHTVFIFIINRI